MSAFASCMTTFTTSQLAERPVRDLAVAVRQFRIAASTTDRRLDSAAKLGLLYVCVDERSHSIRVAVREAPECRNRGFQSAVPGQRRC